MRFHIIYFAIIFSSVLNAQLKTPNLSSSATISQDIGLTEVTIKYSRPSVKGRLIFGKNGLLSYNKMWRTGANNATKITFSEPIAIQGNQVKKGSYTILSIPTENTWQVNWYPYNSNNWNSYVSQKPILSINIPVKKVTNLVETFEIHFEDITLNSASLVLEWERILVKIPLQINEKEKILNSITKVLSGPSNFDYYKAALYLHETKTNLNTALEYIQKVTKSDKALFFQVTREALILKDLRMYKSALKVAERGLQLSKKANNLDFISINEKIIKELKS